MTPILTLSAAPASSVHTSTASVAVSIRMARGIEPSRSVGGIVRPPFGSPISSARKRAGAIADEQTRSGVLEVAQEGSAPRRGRKHERQVGPGEDETNAFFNIARHHLLVVDPAHAGPVSVRATGGHHPV